MLKRCTGEVCRTPTGEWAHFDRGAEVVLGPCEAGS